MWPSWRYEDRAAAGAALAAELAGTIEGPCVVAAIPRGGVAVALPIAEKLRAPLTLSFVRKLSLPRARELAVGAMDEEGHVITNPAPLVGFRFTAEELTEARQRAELEIARQQRVFPVTPLAEYLPGASVILVDDGPATGLTLRAALAHARRHGARQVIVAVPCSSVSAARALQRDADRFLCPWVDPEFLAVGRYYVDFHQISDEEVSALLERARAIVPSRADGRDQQE